MKTCFTSNKFQGHYPVGTAAVVWADSPKEAAQLLSDHLGEDDLLAQAVLPEDMLPFHPENQVRILADGNY